MWNICTRTESGTQKYLLWYESRQDTQDSGLPLCWYLSIGPFSWGRLEGSEVVQEASSLIRKIWDKRIQQPRPNTGDQESSSCLDHGLFLTAVLLFHFLEDVIFVCAYERGKRWDFTSAGFTYHAANSAVQPYGITMPHSHFKSREKNMGTAKQQSILRPLL